MGFAETNSEGRRLVEQGAVTLGDTKVTNPKAQVPIEEGMILRVGKRRVCKLSPRLGEE